MPLIEQRKCHQCGKISWHEFVSVVAPAASYWRCRECGNRRSAPRVDLGPDTKLQPGRIQTPAVCTNVLLVDISSAGARLRSINDEPLPVEPGDSLLFNPQMQPFGELAAYHPATVRWTRDKDCGIEFEQRLAVNAEEILRIVKS